jgi:hypothetical protein
MDAAQLFLFDPIPAKAKNLGLLSIYKFSLLTMLSAQVSGKFFLRTEIRLKFISMHA